VGEIGVRLLPAGLDVSRQLHDCPYARKPQSGFLGWAEGGVDSSHEAEKLVHGVGQWCLRSDGPSSSGELPDPIGVEIAAACICPRTVVRYDVYVSIAEVISRGTTEGSRVIFRRIWQVRAGGGDI
jgi:hypothetical protein